MEDKGQVPQYARGRITGLLDVGKGVRKKSAHQPRINHSTIADRGIDSVLLARFEDPSCAKKKVFLESLFVVADRVIHTCHGPTHTISHTNGDVFGIFKVQRYWSDPESM